jgi:hypothetical protein
MNWPERDNTNTFDPAVFDLACVCRTNRHQRSTENKRRGHNNGEEQFLEHLVTPYQLDHNQIRDRATRNPRLLVSHNRT